MGYRYVYFSTKDRALITDMRERNISFRKIAKEFDVCTDTAIAVFDGTWRPRAVKLPVNDEVVYFDWLVMGSYAAVGRKYGTSEKPVRKKIQRFCEQQGIEL